MKRSLFLLMAFFVGGVLLTACGGKDTGPDNGPEGNTNYESVENDPMDVRIYTLDNGLKVYLSVNQDEPRIMTQIAVRTGSKQDPADATGLAHYLEHMLFKGTSNYSTMDWESEKVLLDEISDLYEAHKQSTDTAERKALYARIDSLSYEAAKIAIPNEYDKMISSLGAKNTNAYTSVEQTVYINDIPSNEMEKWLKIESERFSELVLRLFHTELEAVYEEFNRGQDNDFRKVYAAMLKDMFKKHEYGTQTTIGTGEHLQSPSMESIHKYFSERYVPNNMAICLSGDLDPDKTIAMIEKYFGGFERKDVPEFTFEPEDPITEPSLTEVYGSQTEFMWMGYRFGGVDTDHPYYLDLISSILYNGQAGLIDLDLVQQQQVLRAGCFPLANKDYSALLLNATPRGGQSLDEAKALLLEEVEKLKRGEFEEWMMDAVRKDSKLSGLRTNESNWGRVSTMVDAFIKGEEWTKVVGWDDKLASITKDDVVKFANEHLGNNYVAVYKRTGEDPNRFEVDKPQITQLDIERDTTSPFFKEIEAMESPRVQPLWVDYETAINTGSLANNIPFSSIKNETNELFSMYYILDMGTDNDKKLGMAVKYLEFLGTDKMSAAEVQQEFYKLGLYYNVYSAREKVYITLGGLDESLEAGVKLMEELLAGVKADGDAMQLMINGIVKERNDNKMNKSSILYGGMFNYAKYGAVNPTTYRISEADMRATAPEELTQRLQSFNNYKHRIFFYGRKDPSEVIALLDEHHKVPEQLLEYPEATKFPELEMNTNKVIFVDYDMVQTEIMFVSKASQFNKDLMAETRLFNEYFGSGLSSLVFQEIRESKALAYSAWCAFTTPRSKEESHYVRAYMGVQTDKLGDAVTAMHDLMSELPQAQVQFDAARDAAMKKIETDRITKASIFWSFENEKRRGISTDSRKDVYGELQALDFATLKAFYDANIKGKSYTYLVIGKKSDVDFDVLRNLGEVEELTLEQVFGE